ncbi:MAG: efflux RND transporter periplasmic adaptor subunit [Bacteroidales bacterium]|jgi:multidrug efflux pump subunit AcrA (membrane-fusion protein)|nr:efflux RND transporter periplasmic adaptor subunit [Bacteroidales bacterium]
MKRTIIITGLVAGLILIAMFVFNKLVSKKGNEPLYAQAVRGPFEITVANAGELEAEKAIDILGPDIQTAMSQGSGGGGSRGGHMRLSAFKISDMVPEGTVVENGDYIAQLDRTDYDNSLKEALEKLNTLKASLEMAILDTAVTLTNLRDAIKNQVIAVEEAQITLAQSKYEPPATIRQAELNLDKQIRALEQRKKAYELRKAKALVDIRQTRRQLSDGQELADNLQNFLAQFTITAPAPGMVIYKEEFNGSKRKVGSNVNPFDRIIATLPDLSSMISKTYVSEIEVNKLKTGQTVTITVDALPGKSWQGTVTSIANIGEQLGNSDAKMFEVLIKLDKVSPELRPAMTSYNKILIQSFDDVVYIPAECVHTGADGITYVYKKNKTRQVVVLGEMNDKHIIIEKGLEPGTSVYMIAPEESAKFKLVGQDLIAELKK